MPKHKSARTAKVTPPTDGPAPGGDQGLRAIAQQMRTIPQDLAEGRLPGNLLVAEDLAGRLMIEAMGRGLWRGHDYRPLRAIIDSCTREQVVDRHFGSSEYGHAFGTALVWLRRNPERLPLPIEWSPSGRSNDDLVNGCPLLASIIEHAATMGSPRNSSSVPSHDPSAYIPAKDIIADDECVRSYKDLNRVLDEHPWIRRENPTPRRLNVHAGDWNTYKRRRDAALDEKGPAAGLIAGFQLRYEQAREARE